MDINAPTDWGVTIPRTEPKVKFARIRLLLGIATSCALILIALTFALSMANTVRTAGIIEPQDNIELRATVPGQVATVHVKPGDTVTKGQPLLTLENMDLSHSLTKATLAVSEQQAIVAAKRNNLAATRLNPLPKEYRYTATDLAEQRALVTQRQHELERAERLLGKKSISGLTFKKAELEAVKAQSQLDRIEKRHSLVTANLAQRYIIKAQDALALAQVQLQQREAHLAQIKAKIEALTIRAPQAGTVTDIKEDIGEPLARHAMAAEVVTSERKVIKAYVDESEIQDVIPGQEVIAYSSHYDRYKVGAFPGVVTRVWVRPEDQVKAGYPVEISLTEEPQPLRLGSTVDLKIITGSQKVIEGIVGQ